MAPSNICHRCSGAEENFLHAFRDCSIAKRLWRSLGFLEDSFFQKMDQVKWLKDEVLGKRVNKFLAGLWWSWKARNLQCIGKENVQLYSLISCAQTFVELLHLCFLENDQESRIERWISWHNSTEDITVLNVDGCCFGNLARAGYGGLLRNASGNWICGFAGFYGHSNNLHAELLAIFHGLTLSWNLGFRLIQCYTDSQNALELIKKLVAKRHRYASLICSIQEILDQAWAVKLDHTLREGNHCADMLAKMGTSQDETLQILDTPPQALSNLLLADAMRVAFVRL